MITQSANGSLKVWLYIRNSLDRVRAKLLTLRKATTSQTVLTNVLLPTVPTLIGVYVALWLDNSSKRGEEIAKVVATLTVSEEECDQVKKTLGALNLDNGPVTLPTLGISLLNLLQQPGLLQSLHSQDFQTMVSNLGGIRSSSDEYQQTSVLYHNIELAPITQFAPALLPITVDVKLPATQEEAAAMAAKGRAELESNRKSRLDGARLGLANALKKYSDSVQGFCEVTSRAKGYLE